MQATRPLASKRTASRKRAAAVAVSTLQGAVLFHEGQFEGRRFRVPVFLRRRPQEAVDPTLQAFYAGLLRMLRHDDFRNGEWHLCERTGWPDNHSYLNLLAWVLSHGDTHHLVVVNLSERRSQGRIRIPVPTLAQLHADAAPRPRSGSLHLG